MKAINSATVLKETHIDSKEALVSSVEIETMGRISDHHDNSVFFFKGAVLGFLLCLPFWTVIVWLII
ncbi:MAG: hypothetical protein P8012_15985 [Desulfobacterales bacterium]